MSSPNLPPGAFLTSLNGRRCTAVPRAQTSTAASTALDVPEPTPTQPDDEDDEDDGQDGPPQQEAEPSQAGANPDDETPAEEEGQDDDAPSTPSSLSQPPAPPSQDAFSTTGPVPTLSPLSQPTPVPEDEGEGNEPPPAEPSLEAISQDGVAGAGPSLSEEQVSAEDDAPASVSGPAETPLLRPVASDSQSSLLSPSFPSSLESQPSAILGSPTDDNAASTQAGPDGAQADILGTSSGETGTLITSVTGTSDAEATASEGAGVGGASEANSDGEDDGPELPVAVIAGSVVGAVAFVTMLFLLFWFWRKRRENGRNTLLTPLSTHDVAAVRKERPYIFDQESVGPTPRSTRFRAALGYGVQKLGVQVGGLFGRGSSQHGSGNGRSRYGNLSAHSRNSSIVSNSGARGDDITSRDRFKDWLDRLRFDMLFNWRIRNDSSPEPDPFAGVREKHVENTGAPTGQPDFLTLLGMDERDTERGGRHQRGGPGNGSTSSMERFLGGLGLEGNNNADPFTDANAILNEPAKTAHANTSQANPFTDANDITATSAIRRSRNNYVDNVRHSRGVSIGGDQSIYRESGASVESFEARRNKCRSDPFDLERPELLGRPGLPQGPKLPGPAVMRNGSTSSKRSSGGSSKWSDDPGPDVGPSRATNPIGGRYSPHSGWQPGAQPGRESLGPPAGHDALPSPGSVGKAM